MNITTALMCLLIIVPVSFATTCPNSCYCDDRGEYVSCVGDGNSHFPTSLPPTTTRLELRNCETRDLMPEDFSALTSLEELKLQQCQVETAHNDTFSSNLKLEKLDLSQNSLTQFTSAFIKDLQQLKYLDLSSNSIENLELTNPINNLEQLNLRDNRLSELTTRSFAGLHKVQYLNLDSNNISFIEVGAFQYLTNLAHLIVSNNPLSTLSRLDFFGSRLQYIDISSGGLDMVPQSLTRFVRDLRLAKNNLTRISAGDFESYPYLGLLVLDDNFINDIEEDALGRLEYLMRLWLNGNRLTHVPSHLPSGILALYMEENKISALESYSFRGLYNLEQLFLQRNVIKIIQPCAFCDLHNLRSLDLQANRISQLRQGIFANLSRLETLDLSQNDLKVIDARCFSELTHLATLQMSRVHSQVTIEGNIDLFEALRQLQTLEVYDSSPLVRELLNSTRTLHGLKNLRELNIMHNKLERLRPDLPSFLPFLRVIKMSGNLWHCDSDAKWLAHWIKQSNVQFYSSYNIRCASPEDLHLKPLMMLTDGDFRDHPSSTNITITTTTNQPVSKHTTSKMTITFKSAMVLPYGQVNKVNTTSEKSEITQPGIILPETITTIQSETSANQVIQATTTNEPRNLSEEKHLSTISHEVTTDTSKTLSSTRLLVESQPQILSTERTFTQMDGSPKAAFVKNSSSPQRQSSKLTSTMVHEDGATVIVPLLACTILVPLVALVVMAFRLCHPYQPVAQKRRSISYYPQKDEVSIVTLTDGPSDGLYYITDDGQANDSLSQELLPVTKHSNLLY